MGGIINKRIFFPLKVAMLVGGSFGLHYCYSALRHYEYLRYRLYNTTARLFAIEVDRHVLIFAVALYALWLIYIIGTAFKGRLRIVWQTVVLVSVLSAVAVKLGVREWGGGFGSALREIAVGDMRYQVLAAVACAILGIAALISVRRTSHRKSGTDDPSVIKSALAMNLRRIILGIERQSALWAGVLILFLAFNIVALAFSSGVAVSRHSKPNVIIIMIDTLRADHVGVYGYSRNTTRNLDRFAKECILFKNASSNSSWTTASVSSFMSSQYPQTTLAPGDKDAFDGQELADIRSQCVTIAEALKDRGYETGAVVSNPQYGASRGGQQGFNFFKEVEREDVTRTASDWLQCNKDKKLFFFGLYLGPHTPYKKYPDFDFDHGYKGVASMNENLADEKVWPGAKDNLEHIEAAYDSSLAQTDYQIGQLFGKLKRYGLYDDSMIIILADHGEEFLDHGGFFHGHKLYRELLHVPLMIKLPKQSQGKVMNNPFSLIDLFPTILGVLKLDPSSIHGKGSAVNLLAAERPRDDYLYAATDLGVSIRSVQHQHHKYILDVRKGKGMLFNINLDPFEKSDIAAREPRVADQLKEFLLAMELKARATGFADSASPEKKVSEMEKAKLRSLGYLQ